MTAQIQENHNIVVIPRLVFQDYTEDKVQLSSTRVRTALYTRSKAKQAPHMEHRPDDMAGIAPTPRLEFSAGSDMSMSWSSSPSLSRSRSPHSSSTSLFTSCPASPSPEPSPAAVARTYWEQRPGNSNVTITDSVTTSTTSTSTHLQSLPAKNLRQPAPTRSSHAPRPARAAAPYTRPPSSRRLSPRGHCAEMDKTSAASQLSFWPSSSSFSRSGSSHSISSTSYQASTTVDPLHPTAKASMPKQENSTVSNSDQVITIRLRNLPITNQSTSGSVRSTRPTRSPRTTQYTPPTSKRPVKKGLPSQEPATRPRQRQGNNAVTTTDNITTIRLRGLTVRSPKRAAPACTTTPYSKPSNTAATPSFAEPATIDLTTASASCMSVSHPSWPSLSSSLPSFSSSSSSSFSSCPTSPTSDISSISSKTSLPDALDRIPAAKPRPQQRREVIVISSDDEDGEEDGKGSGASTPTSLAPSNDKHKYRIASQYRRVVETIFPAVEVEHKSTLERAYATSKTLREKYLITRYLGSGASGFVVAAKRAFDGREVAIKVIPHTADHIEGRVQKELDIMLRLSEHNNVIGFLDYFTSSLYGDIDPDDQSNKDISYIVTEMGGFSLFDFIELHKPAQQKDASTRFKNIQELTRSSPPSKYGSTIHEEAARSIFAQLALALHSMHSQCIVHGDVKDENALISMDPETKAYHAKLCDFGHSKYLAPGTPPGFAFYGTTVLAPPEMDKNVAAREQARDPNRRSSSQTKKWDVFSGYEADVWALGLTLYTMIQGDLPKELMEADSTRAHRRTRASRTTFPFTMPDNIDRDLQDLLKKMLAVDPTRRINMNQVIKHPWITRSSR